MSVFKDERFKHIVKDPKFIGVPKKEKKVCIDERFQAMFTDKKFQLEHSVDKRGRPIKHAQVENFKKFYHLESDKNDVQSSVLEQSPESYSSAESSAEDDISSQKECSASVSIKENLSDAYVGSDPENSEVDPEIKESLIKAKKRKELLKSDSKVVDEYVKSITSELMNEKLKDLTIDYARGGANLYSSDSSSDESTSDSDDDIEHNWGELDRDADRTDEATKRFAVCNMDWDRVCSKDLMILFHSFLPSGGVVQSVTIYPSEFGLERMKEEDLKGPAELVVKNDGEENSSNDEADIVQNRAVNGDDDEDEISHKNMEKLREYQIKRLKYYYAVVEFDSAETANHVYTECDGMEYESSSTKLDLRFIPDDMTFEQEPKETCSELPDSSKYLPRLFANTALQQGTVRLTWDETDPDRLELSKKLANGTIDEEKIKNYIAMSSEESEESQDELVKEGSDSDEASDNDGRSSVEKYRSLIAELQKNEEEKKKGEVQMEISWDLNIQSKADERKEMMNESQLTPFERMLKKKKERQKQKTKEKNDDSLFSDDEIPSDVDLNNPFFRDELGDDYIKKKKEKKKPTQNFNASDNENERRQKDELDLLLSEEMAEDRGKKHFNLKAIQKAESSKKVKKSKRLKEANPDEEDNFKLNLEDKRFEAIFTSHLYNVDPADSHFRKTKAMQDIIEEKSKRRKLEDDIVHSEAKSAEISKTDKLGLEVNKLIKSVKMKSKMNK